jgi:hypothetical protein
MTEMTEMTEMTPARGWPSSALSAEEKRGHVLAYLELGYGSKGEYLRRHGLQQPQISKWRAAMCAGTLEVGLVPREGLYPNDPMANREGVRLIEQVARLQQRLADLQAEHAEQLADKQAEIEAARAAVEAVGKAIALLQAGNGSAGSTTGN